MMTDLKLTAEDVKEIEARACKIVGPDGQSWERNDAKNCAHDALALCADLLAALEENELLRAALKKVAKWDDHRCEWPADEQRDFYRRIALDALGMTYEEVSE